MRKILSLALLASFLLVGCTSQNNNSSSPTPTQSPSMATEIADPNELNLDDATWLAMMLAHHQQAVDMSDLPLEQTTNQEIKDLATQIRGAQYPEMEYMNGILYEGGYREPIDIEEHLMHMPGMLSQEAFANLAALSGKEFDKAFLESMIAHHQGAIDMSTTMLATGSNVEVKELAQKIIDAQTLEISQMQVMLGDLS